MLVRVDDNGETRDSAKKEGIIVEIYDVPLVHLGSFLSGIPYPLGLGKVELASGEWVTGFIACEAALKEEGVEDVTHHGGWAKYIASKL